ncbi:MAG TPA: patatin-like phospholipase family protein [Rhizomicrobium sp.]|jgi:NTE family protein
MALAVMLEKSGFGAVLLAALLLAGCAGKAAMNQPLSPDALQNAGNRVARGGYRITDMPKAGAPDVLVMLSFSGGGKRSAAFGYGVLRGLRDFTVTAGGRDRRMLDLVDMMTSVSGGSFPAAYYGLYRDKIFTDFEKDFLSQDIESYIWGTYLLPWHLGWMFDPTYGTNDRMAEVYDKLMFHGATYADLLRAGRPLISIDATDVDHGLAFPFVQEQFDLLCSDITTYPIARAVAASNGFPVIFTPITLKSYRAQCGSREPAWLRGYTGTDPLSRVHEQARAARIYLDAENTRYVHLMDGGISDNLAMRGIINAMLVITGASGVEERFNFSAIRRIVLISADGEAANDAATARREVLSSLGQIFSAVSGGQIDSYNFETMVLAKGALDGVRDTVRKQRCAKGPVAADGHACGDVESYFVHLSLAGVTDPAERERLQQIPTGLTIDPADVALLVAAGEAQVKNSPMLIKFRDSLGPVPTN